MKSADQIKKFFKSAAINTNPKMDEIVLNKVLIAHEKTANTNSTAIEPNIWRIIMKNPITKLAVAAVVIIAVTISINQFGNPTTSVAWGDVLKKVQASRGVIYRIMSIRSWKSDEPDYEMNYMSNSKSRLDSYKADQIFKTIYGNINTKIAVLVDHIHKSYVRMTIEEMKQDDFWTDPKSLIQRFLSHKHRELEKKRIEGVLCEGIETTDPDFFGPDPLLDSLTARVWVSVETGYPIKFEDNIVRKNGEIRIEEVADQFQWDVKLDESMFEPSIPPDYIDISP
jgi:hypothetical protein